MDALTDRPVDLTPEDGGPLDKSNLMAASQLRPWRTARDLVLTWIAVLGILEFALRIPSVWAWALAFLAMGVAQNHLVLWTHEASHYGLSRRKALNDQLADLFISGPTGVVVAQYRWQHF